MLSAEGSTSSGKKSTPSKCKNNYLPVQKIANYYTSLLPRNFVEILGTCMCTGANKTSAGEGKKRAEKGIKVFEY